MELNLPHVNPWKKGDNTYSRYSSHLGRCAFIISAERCGAVVAAAYIASHAFPFMIPLFFMYYLCTRKPEQSAFQNWALSSTEAGPKKSIPI